MADVTITPRKNGPYRVEGVIKLVDYEGNEFKVTDSVIFLCRCGHSANKPFCDGSHKRVGFDADTRAPQAEETPAS
ncbi:MAG TPA: CDGSH iron-sulfur domain-containing protein [Chloroflexota bacterium]|jgi:CDGSH-type Zn-finger protein|nr:CDGSH iron-sulfur domain-containing protein [Chloroflexota bacterium]